jgi:hypothetical protein
VELRIWADFDGRRLAGGTGRSASLPNNHRRHIRQN